MTSTSLPEQGAAFEKHEPPTINVLLLPASKSMILPRPKTVLGLLQRLDIPPGTALVIRDGGLLTPDREILPKDEITIRIVTSSG